MREIQLGEIYRIEKAFEDDPSQSKIRPAVVVDIDEETGNVISVVATTSQGKKESPSYFDKYKFPLLNWRKYGLDKQSWCLCYAVIEIPREALLDYVGELNDSEYDRLIEFMENVD